MGEPPPVPTYDNRIWIHARQYTGRVVTVTNDKLFDQPVYTFTREFPYIWEEIRIPVPYKADRQRAEAILLECARKVTEPFAAASESARRALEARYSLVSNGA
jgi:small-conductance mechanosensitive channel